MAGNMRSGGAPPWEHTGEGVQMTAEEELEPLLAQLRSAHDVLPFMETQLVSSEAVFRRMPDAMVDLLTTSPDFALPARGGPPVWLQLEGEGGQHATLVVARPQADGEFWVIAPAARSLQDPAG